MLRVTGQGKKMGVLLPLMLTSLFMVVVAAQPLCDPLTQYALNGECCKMCGPGTRMSSQSGMCQEPQCQPCEKNEYQEKYTKESMCQRQPYCDPNRNFLVPEHKSDKRSVCMCKEGFHCSSEECITCVAHTTCQPGYGVKTEGSHAHDTVCEECPEGTFSDENSAEGVCKKLTECGDREHLEEQGTKISDNICVKATRGHVVVIVVVAVMAAVGVGVGVGVFVFLFLRGKRGDATRKVKGCIKRGYKGLGENLESQRETEDNTLIPTQAQPDPVDEESTMPEMVSSQEEGSLRTPVEDEDELSQENSINVALTVNGNLVTQENGKAEKLSRQESQPHSQTSAE